MKITVRRAGAAELALVRDVLTEAATWLEQRGEPLWEQDELALGTLDPDVRAGHYYLAFSDAEVVGVFRFTLDDPLFWPEAAAGDAGYVHRLAVRRAWAGGKLSSELLGWAAEEARRLGCRYLRLDCVSTRQKLRQIYERFGFRYHSDQHVGPYLVARYELTLA